MKPSSNRRGPEQRRCEICGDSASCAVVELDGSTQQQHDYCARCAAAKFELDLVHPPHSESAEHREPLGEWLVEARQSSSWASVEQFLSAFLQPDGRAPGATEQEKRRIAPRVARMVRRLDGAMPEAVREFLAKYGSP